jgi:hemolysin activation/secretion protein
MKQFAKASIAVLLSSFISATFPVLSQAAPQPDAGTILDTLRSKDFVQPKKSDPGIDVQQESKPVIKNVEGIKTKVSAFRITGASVFTEAQLQARIASSVGKELSLAELGNVAAEISLFYRNNGYFVARAYLPAQEIKDGVVEIAVIEGRIGKIDVNLQGAGRLTDTIIKQIIGGSVKQGDVVSEARLERGLLLANDLAGVSINSTLVPGASVGTSDLVVEAKQTGAISGGLDYDNFGNKFTGASRVGASVNFNNPARIGDQIALRLMTSGSGMAYGRASYVVPAGAAGTKIGAAYSSMNYKLGGDFSAANLEGNAEIASLYVIHPFSRSRNYSLYGQLGYDGKHMVDKGKGSKLDDKRTDLFMAGLSGNSRDALGGGGLNSYNVTLFSGKLDLSASPRKASDAASAKSEGSFAKTAYNVARVQRLNDDNSLYAAISGQYASKNLDSSEKFALGGSAGIRAYPQGEATGDDGQLFNLELRHDLNTSSYGSLQLVGFIDAGHIQLNKNPWSGWNGNNANLANSYSLAGAGIGVNLSQTGTGDYAGGYSVKAYLAAKIGSNSGVDSKGNDSDGTHGNSRFWLQAIKWF